MSLAMLNIFLKKEILLKIRMGMVFNDYFDLGTSVETVVTSSGAGVLNAWVDWNQNGSWLDSGEQDARRVAVAAA